MNAQGFQDWVASNILPIVLVCIGLLIVAGARKGKMSDALTTVTLVVIGIMVMVGGAVFYAVGGDLADAISG